MEKKQQKKTKSSRGAVDAVAFGVQRLYDKSAPLLIAEALLFGAAGVLMLVRPIGFLTAITFMVGVGLVLFGLYRTIAGFVSSRGYGGGWLDVVFGIMGVVIGILFCVYPVGSIISLVYVFVLLFLFNAIRVLVFAVNMVRARFGHYVFNLIMAIILVVLAILLLVWPMAGAVAMVIWLAITLLMYAAADIYMYIELRRLKKVVAD